MKNIVFSFVLAVLVGLSLPIFRVEAQVVQVCGNWEDVSSDVAGYQDMLEVCELNWIKGGGGKLNLENKLKRIELVAVVNRVLEVETSSVDGVLAYENVSAIYTDLGEYRESRDWMYKALYYGGKQEANFSQKFWKGYEDGTFKMTKEISFAEFSKLILFAFEKMGELNGNFRLVQYNGDDWYSNYFNFLDSKGVLDYSDGEFLFEGELYSVHDSMTRKDAIRFISKILDRDIYTSGKLYQLNEMTIELPFYLDEDVAVNDSVRVWKDKVGDGILRTVKVLEGEDVVMPAEFVSVYVPTRLSSEVSNMYRIDKCNESNMCVRAFWLVLKRGQVLVVEGSFAKEKTTQGERVVNDILDTIKFN